MNADAQFKDFVARQQRPDPAGNTLDWKRERDEWLTYLEQLYDYVAQYLHEYITTGEISLHESAVKLNEENIGLYDAKRLTIVIGIQEIALSPIGTLLIGSKGRVDVEGSAGTSRLVLVDKDIIDPRSMIRVTVPVAPYEGPPLPPAEPPAREKVEWAWKIVSRPPAIQFIDLNKDTLFRMLMEVSNG